MLPPALKVSHRLKHRLGSKKKGIAMDKLISLSPSKLNLFTECPRCFWDTYTGKCPKPRGVFPSLPGGMDRIIKSYADRHRGTLPEVLKGKVPGVLLADINKIKQWRHWKTGLTYFDKDHNIKLIGGLDDCLVDGEYYIPLDWKSKGSEPSDSGEQYYQAQLDCYNLMLASEGYKTRNEGYLVYLYPTDCIDSIHGRTLDNGIAAFFKTSIYKLECSADRAKELVIKAAECLRGKRPTSVPSCEHCRYLIMEDALTKQQKEGGK